MKHFEITVRPLSEEAKASGRETFVREVDAFILSAVSDIGDGKTAELVQVRGSEIVWAALVNLVQKLAKDFPTEFFKGLTVAMASAMSGESDETIH